MIQTLNGHSKIVRKRLEILRGAAAEFRERGYAGTRMEDIARRTAMTPGNLYYYFRGKHSLLEFCQNHSLDVLLGEARKVLRGRGTSAARVKSLLEAQLRCMLDDLHGAAAHIEFHALPRRALARIIAKRDRYERLLRGLIARGVRSGEFAACDPKLVTLAMLGAVNWTVRWYRPGGPQTPEAIARAFVEYLVRGLIKSAGR